MADPRALRALAHPIRWQLIDILDHEGIATVTRCSEALGQSTATCSYHLGILAKYGFVIRETLDRYAGRGREVATRPDDAREVRIFASISLAQP